jgi:hypothetical protein
MITVAVLYTKLTVAAVLYQKGDNQSKPSDIGRYSAKEVTVAEYSP